MQTTHFRVTDTFAAFSYEVSLHQQQGRAMPTSTMTYAFYREMPDHLVYQALKMLPDWKVDVNERFDARCADPGSGVKTVVLS